MSHGSRVRVTGPLVADVEGFKAELAERGYRPRSAEAQVRLLAHLSRWLADEGLGRADLSPEILEQFRRARRGRGSTRLLSPRGIAPLGSYLRGLGVVAEPVSRVAATPTETLLAAYHGYLVRERRLVASSVRLYTNVARLFLLERSGPVGRDLEHLSAGDVTTFVLGECRRRSVASAKTVTTGLRSLLRFLFVDGRVPVLLVEAVPTRAGWRLTSLPRALDAAHVARLLASCDRGTATGRRDVAILTLLARLGLRAHEVAGLELHDIDWRVGEMMIAGKGGRRDRLPLPSDVGEALADYVGRVRPRCASRRVFLSVRAPLTGISSSAVRSVVHHACLRAGLPRVGAHRLRHSTATAMLRAGGSLAEIGQVLRHRSLLTTAIYAKVDRAALATLARPWPGSAA
jgi:integrase/recombinase XerD